MSIEKQSAEEGVLQSIKSDISNKEDGESEEQEEVFHDALEEIGGKIVDLAELDKHA